LRRRFLEGAREVGRGESSGGGHSSIRDKVTSGWDGVRAERRGNAKRVASEKRLAWAGRKILRENLKWEVELRVANMRIEWAGKKFATVVAAAALVVMLAAGARAQDEAGDGGGRGGMQSGGMPPGTRGVMGTITAVASDQMTVKTQDGQDWEVTFGPNTRVMHDRDPAHLADLKVGYGVLAMGQPDAKQANTLHAGMAVFQTAGEVKERLASLGKTWIAGRVTAVSGTKITIQIQVPGIKTGTLKTSEQTIEVDENTAFKKGRDSVTLADLKAGDFVMGKGALKQGTFVPATLNIRSAGDRRGRGPVAGGPGQDTNGSAPAGAAPDQQAGPPQ
jgi:hypothetical protein